MTPPFVQHLSANGRAHFSRSLEPRVLKDRELVLSEGDACRSLLFVEAGSLRVFKSGGNGREITLYRVRPGELCLLSISSLLAKTPYPASVSAGEPTTVWQLNGDTFRALHASEVAFQEVIAAQLHEMLTAVMTLVSEVAFRKVDERLARLVLEETSRSQVYETTHERLAQHLGTAREVVSRLLENLRDDGVLRVDRGQLRVLDRPALDAIARGSVT